MAALTSARVERQRRSALLRGIYVILNENERALTTAQGVLAAGVTVIQYRAKNGIHQQHLESLVRLVRERDALLVVDDDWRAALDAGCDGVHLGPDDDGFADVAPIRRANPAWIVGLSCGTAGEAMHAAASDVDYIGVGSVYATPSKADAGAPIGIEGLMRVARATPLPVAAIGGIGAQNLVAIRDTGVAMAAVISAIAGDANPERAARRLVEIWNAAP